MKWLLVFLRKIKDKVEDHFAEIIAATFIGVFSLIAVFSWKWVITKHSIEFYGWIWLLLFLASFFLLIHFFCIMLCKVSRIRDPADITNVLEKWWRHTEGNSLYQTELTLYFSSIDKKERLKKGSAKNYLQEVVTKDGNWSIVREGLDTLLAKRKESREVEILRNSKSSL